MSKLRIYIAIALGVLLAPQALCENYPIRGRVIDRLTRRGVAYAAVVIVGQGTKGASADAEGEFVIEGVAPGIYRLEASMLGYKTTVTPEYLVSAATPFIEIEMDEERQALEPVLSQNITQLQIPINNQLITIIIKSKYYRISLTISIFGCIFGCRISNTPSHEHQTKHHFCT